MPRVKADKKLATETKSSSKVVAAAKQKILENGFQTPNDDEMKVNAVEGGRSRGRKLKAEVTPHEVDNIVEKPTKKTSAGRGGGRKKSAIAEEQEQEEKKQTAKKMQKVVAEKGEDEEIEAPAVAKNGVVKKTKGRAKKTSTKNVDVIQEKEIIEKPAKITKEKNAGKTQKKKSVEPPAEEELHETAPSEEEQAPPKAEGQSASKRAVKEKMTTKSKSKETVNTEKKPAAKRGRGSKKDAAAVVEDIIEEVSEDKAEPIESPKKKAKKEAKQPKTAPEKKKNKDSAAEDKIDNAEIEPKNKKAATEKKPRSRKRAATDDENTSGAADDNDDDSKPTRAKRATPLNATTTLYNKSDFDLTLGNGSASDEKPFTLKISSWNVAGLRSWLKKDGLKYLEYEEPDIFCMQETKCTNEQLPEEATRIPGYHPYWLCMPGGYAGVAIYSKIMPIHVEYGIGNAEFDTVGRLITAEYEKFYLLNVYVPNSGRKLVNLEARMRWEKLFQAYIKKLDALKPVIVCGDMNCSHQEIDLANPKSNTRSAGFTQEERDKLTELLALGFVDTFRHLYADKKGAYTYWTYMGNARSRNVGWRLDYFIVSERVVNRVVDNCIRSQCMGSDHCPITLFLKN